MTGAEGALIAEPDEADGGAEARRDYKVPAAE